jgi:hypothetical protein
MSNQLIVQCDSLCDKVVMSSNVGILSTLTWCVNEDSIGFKIDNVDFLVDVYWADFYILDEVAAMQFIMNMANKVKNDQELDEIVYIDSQGNHNRYPSFLPCTTEDDAIVVLPRQQIVLCRIWSTFQKNLNGFLNEDFLDIFIPAELRAGFIDLLNVELSLLRKEENSNE